MADEDVGENGTRGGDVGEGGQVGATMVGWPFVLLMMQEFLTGG